MTASSTPHTSPLRIRFTALLTVFGFAGAISCSDEGLLVTEAPDEAPVDNLVTVSGNYCLNPAESETFPLKLLFIIDISGSMQFTDTLPNTGTTGRRAAVDAVIDQFAGDTGVSGAIVAFNESLQLQPPEGFVSPVDLLDTSVLDTQDSLTNYQAGLAEAFRRISEDAQASGLAELARTRYVILFLSDGTPDPRCTEGCLGDVYDFCETGTASDGSKIDWQDFEPCEDYNQDFQILQKVTDLMALRDAYGIGDLRLHTALLYPPELNCGGDPADDDAACAAFGIDPVAAEALLSEMALQGNGVFRNFGSGESIDFLTYDIQAIFIDYALRELVLVNRSARPTTDGFVADTDGDGLDDATEQLADLDPHAADTDADGFDDALEVQFASSGYDPLDPTRPGGCDNSDPSFDEDGDELSDCAEERLGLNRQSVDTDGDGMPDGLEQRSGTDPSNFDIDGDLDFDGFSNGDELRYGLDPRVRDSSERRTDLGYRYSLGPSDVPKDKTAIVETCFDFSVSGVTLVTPLPSAQEGSIGWNNLLVFGSEGLAGTPADQGLWKKAQGCGQFIEPDYKVPADGQIELTDLSFVELWQGESTCIELDAVAP